MNVILFMAVLFVGAKVNAQSKAPAAGYENIANSKEKLCQEGQSDLTNTVIGCTKELENSAGRAPPPGIKEPAKRRSENEIKRDPIPSESENVSDKGIEREKQAKVMNNPFVEIFQVKDPDSVKSLDAMYGAYNGNRECLKKIFCIIGNNLHILPAREIIFGLLRNVVPSDYSLYFDILRVSSLYGQNCEVYRCTFSASTS